MRCMCRQDTDYVDVGLVTVGLHQRLSTALILVAYNILQTRQLRRTPTIYMPHEIVEIKGYSGRESGENEQEKWNEK